VELLHQRCAGLDIGKKDLKACVRTPNPSGRRWLATGRTRGCRAEVVTGLNLLAVAGVLV
jgi:hypothetical protein